MKLLPSLLFQGSVKDILGKEGQSPYIFAFSDRYSLFDWGAMPDTIPHKGAALAKMSSLLFSSLGRPEFWSNWSPTSTLSSHQLTVLEMVKKDGVPHHYLPAASKDYEGDNLMAVKPVTIIHPDYRKEESRWDYSNYQTRPEDCLVPLEVIFRFGVPQGSSLTKRTSDPDYCKEIGLASNPKTGDKFSRPVIEYSTKLEESDRYLRYREASNIAGLTENEFAHLTSLTTLIALRLKDLFSELEIELWDGKFEFAFIPGESTERKFMLVDAIGPDELRLIYRDLQLSKESIRTLYRHTDWGVAVEESKAIARQRGVREWKAICQEELQATPHSLAAQEIETISSMYQNLTNHLYLLTEKTQPFSPTMTMDQVITSLRGIQ